MSDLQLESLREGFAKRGVRASSVTGLGETPAAHECTTSNQVWHAVTHWAIRSLMKEQSCRVKKNYGRIICIMHERNTWESCNIGVSFFQAAS